MIHIVETPIDVTDLLARVNTPESGASSLFLGTVRNHNLGKAVRYLEYEAYEPMALKEIEKIADQAMEKWPLHKVGVIHRLGQLHIGDVAVAIAASSAHRKDSLEAIKYIIDTLKKEVPIWKKEYWEDGSMWLENCCG